jgi:hypothetical protein
MQNKHKVMQRLAYLGREKGQHKGWPGHVDGCEAGSSHRDSDESQQKHQDCTGQRQDDRHHRDDGIDRILFDGRHIMGVCIVVGMVSWLGHGGSWVFGKTEAILPLW